MAECATLLMRPHLCPFLIGHILFIPGMSAWQAAEEGSIDDDIDLDELVNKAPAHAHTHLCP